MDELVRRIQNTSISQAGPSNNTIQINVDENETSRSISPIVTYQITHDYTKLPKDRPSLNILYANVKSIKTEGKIDEFKCIIKMIPKTVHLILLTETWTKTDDSNDDSLELENYNLALSSRTGKTGGGAGAYILKGMQYSTVDVYRNGNNYLWVYLDELKLNVGVVYFPGNTGKKTFLQDLKLQLQNKKDHRAIVVGDFNINILESNKSKTYEKILSDTGFVILNKKSQEYFTRKNIEDDVEKKISIIDHVLSNLGAGEFHVALIDSSLADHRQVYIEIRNPKPLPENRERNETINQNAKKQSLGKIEYNNKDVSALENAMIQIINIIKSNHLKQGDWITEKICKGITLKNLFYQKYQRYPNKKTRKLFDKVHNKTYEEREANKNDYTILAFIKSGFNKKIVPSKLSVDSKTVTGSKEICEQFNIYYLKITGLNHNPSDQPEMPLQVEEDNQIQLTKITPCTAKEISEIIVSLDPLISAGIDGISVENIKGSNENICKTLSTFINDCFDAGFYPDCLKILKVIPMHKSGWKGKLKNYTFEFALPVFSRILEKLLWRRLNIYVPIHYVTENKYGYREKPNTVPPTINLISKIKTSIDEKKIVLGLFVDLNKTLNKVNHSLLLKKLKSLGINESELQILESYFVNRKYIVSLGDFESNPRNIKQGVPQGSILGHLLFLIYINDVHKLKLYGDITVSAEKITLFYYGENVKDLVEKAQQDLNSVSKFFQDSGLVVDPNETHSVVFTNKTKIDRNCKLYLNGIEIEETKQAEYFGLMLDSKLTWKPHILIIKSLLKLYYENLKSVGHCSRKQGLVFYNACIRPHFDYLIEVWGTASAASKALLQGPHTNLRRKLNAVETLQVLSIKQNIFYKTCILVFKIIHQSTTQVSFKTKDSRVTRIKNELSVPFARTNYGQQNLNYAGAVAYNGLPEDVREAKDIKIFKKNLRTYLGIEKKRKLHQKRQVPNEPVPSQATTQSKPGPSQQATTQSEPGPSQATTQSKPGPSQQATTQSEPGPSQATTQSKPGPSQQATTQSEPGPSQATTQSKPGPSQQATTQSEPGPSQATTQSKPGPSQQATTQSESGPSQATTQSEAGTSEDTRNTIVYKCTKCDTNEVFTPNQRNKHKVAKHPELPKGSSGRSWSSWGGQGVVFYEPGDFTIWYYGNSVLNGTWCIENKLLWQSDIEKNKVTGKTGSYSGNLVF